MARDGSSLTLTPADIDVAVSSAFAGGSTMTCVDLGRDFALVRHDLVPGAVRPGGFVPGPTQFGIADAALWYLVFGVLDRVELMALTADLDITFLRPASGTALWARADLLSAGTRKIVGSVRVWCDDREDSPSSVAKGTYVLP